APACPGAGVIDTVELNRCAVGTESVGSSGLLFCTNLGVHGWGSGRCCMPATAVLTLDAHSSVCISFRSRTGTDHCARPSGPAEGLAIRHPAGPLAPVRHMR